MSDRRGSSGSRIGREDTCRNGALPATGAARSSAVPPGSLAARVLLEIRRIASHELGTDRDIELQQTLADHPELDSVGRVVLAVGLEDRFRIKLDDSEGIRVTTVGELVDLVVRRVRAGGGDAGAAS